MKSKEDIHLAIASLTMVIFKSDGVTRKMARKAASVLCWAMDYPSDFDLFMDKVKEQNLFGDMTPERLDEIIKESIEQVKEHEQHDDGGHSE
jgi:hypothetical protein